MVENYGFDLFFQFGAGNKLKYFKKMFVKKNVPKNEARKVI